MQTSTSGNAILSRVTKTGGSIDSQSDIDLATRLPTASAIASESILSSSSQFGRKVQEVVVKSSATRSQDPVMITSNPQQLYNLRPANRGTATHDHLLPTEDEAFQLLETVNLFIGQSQSHYDSREIADRVGMLYENIEDTTKCYELWYLELMLIFAVGKLFAATSEHEEQGLPGKDLFDAAEKHFPSISVQYANGRLGVELNALMAVYLQMVNRSEEAYLYVRVLNHNHIIS